MNTVSVSPCTAHSSCLNVRGLGHGASAVIAALQGKFSLTNQAPWLLMPCGCFFDSPIIGTPHDHCDTCFGTGWFIYLPELHVKTYREERLARILAEAGFDINRLEQTESPAGPPTDDENDNNLNLRATVTSYIDVVTFAFQGPDASNYAETILGGSVLNYRLEQDLFVVDPEEAHSFSAALMYLGCWLLHSQRDYRRADTPKRFPLTDPPF